MPAMTAQFLGFSIVVPATAFAATNDPDALYQTADEAEAKARAIHPDAEVFPLFSVPFSL
jgi:hypothetical protein